MCHSRTTREPNTPPQTTDERLGHIADLLARGLLRWAVRARATGIAAFKNPAGIEAMPLELGEGFRLDRGVGDPVVNEAFDGEIFDADQS